MNPITVQEVSPPNIYASKRDDVTKKIIALKKKRRVATRTFSFLFENRDTVLNQINEMVFIENVQDQEEIKRLVRVYNDQVPARGELSVSMFIEFEDQQQMVREIPRLAGIEKSVYITFDGNEIKAKPEEGRSTEVLESTLQYLKFNFSKEDLSKFANAKNVYIETRKGDYSETVKLQADLLEDLKRELVA